MGTGPGEVLGELKTTAPQGPGPAGAHQRLRAGRVRTLQADEHQRGLLQDEQEGQDFFRKDEASGQGLFPSCASCASCLQRGGAENFTVKDERRAPSQRASSSELVRGSLKLSPDSSKRIA